MSGVTGIAGVWFEASDPAGISGWYAKELGLLPDGRGGTWFPWLDLEGVARFSTWEPRAPTPDPAQPFGVRYWVDGLDELVARVRSAGETVLETGERGPGGRFARVLDPEGQAVELIEPSGMLPRTGPTTGPPVSGIGGVFFTSPNPAALKAWYAERLGVLPGEDGYVSYRARDVEGNQLYTAWEIFPDDSPYLLSEGEPTALPLMTNFRVADLGALLERLRESGAWVDSNVESYEYGNFGWIRDPMGARLELWEPSPDPFG